MSEWVVACSLGPVGQFIGGGRRSRDLWWGSSWVSDCTVHVANKLSEHARLIVPSPKRLAQIVATYSSDHEARTFRWRISNRILARLEAENLREVERVLESCRQCANDYLANELGSIDSRLKSRNHSKWQAWSKLCDPHHFDQQIRAIKVGDFVEMFAAWAPLPEPAHLSEAISRTQLLLDARKNSRFFSAAHWSQDGRSRSDLDSGRDSVLRAPRDIKDAVDVQSTADLHLAREKLGIRPDEELDAIGLGRRVATFVEGPQLLQLPFPPLSRVAADPWLAAAKSESKSTEALRQIVAILDRERKDDLFFAWCSPARDPEAASWDLQSAKPAHESLFCFDASILFEGGLEASFRELERVGQRAPGSSETDSALKALAELREPLACLHATNGPPPPYYVLLAMDGDRVGNALAGSESATVLEQRVAALDDFADRSEKIVRDHHGCAFYIGGDDLLAYLPIDLSLAAAAALAKQFSECTREAFVGEPVSLSAGLVIAHVKSDLRAVRRSAQDALHHAKELRLREDATNSWMVVQEMPRSGPTRACSGPLERLAGDLYIWQRLFIEDRLSLRTAHLLWGFANRFKSLGESTKDDLGLELARYRVIAQGLRSEKSDNTHLVERASGLDSWAKAEELATEFSIASRMQRIARLRPKQGGTA